MHNGYNNLLKVHWFEYPDNKALKSTWDICLLRHAIYNTEVFCGIFNGNTFLEATLETIIKIKTMTRDLACLENGKEEATFNLKEQC